MEIRETQMQNEDEKLYGLKDMQNGSSRSRSLLSNCSLRGLFLLSEQYLNPFRFPFTHGPSFRSGFCHRKPSVGHFMLFYVFHSFVSLLRCYNQKMFGYCVQRHCTHPMHMQHVHSCHFLLLLLSLWLRVRCTTGICSVFSPYCPTHCISDFCTTSKLFMFGLFS